MFGHVHVNHARRFGRYHIELSSDVHIHGGGMFAIPKLTVHQKRYLEPVR